MRTLWNTYKKIISNNCNANAIEYEETVSYWRNRLFSATIIFVLPLCFIALIPSLFLITYENKELITILHISTIGVVCFVAFVPKVKITTRKMIFSVTTLIFATVLNIFTSPSSGSVLVYFLAACIYSIIIFDNKYAYWWSHIVLLISILFSAAIHYNVLDFSHNVDMLTVNEWVAVSANLVFLCYLSSALIPKIFLGLENHISELSRLKNELEQSKAVLQTKNDKLEEIAWTQSHVVRAPIARVLGIVNYIETEKDDLENLPFWLGKLKDSTNEMDQIVKMISEKAHDIQMKENSAETRK